MTIGEKRMINALWKIGFKNEGEVGNAFETLRPLGMIGMEFIFKIADKRHNKVYSN